MSPADRMSPEGTRALGGLLLALAGAPRELRAQLSAPGTVPTTTDHPTITDTHYPITTDRRPRRD